MNAAELYCVLVEPVVEPLTGDLADPRVVVLLAIDAIGVEFVGEIRIGVCVCRRGEHQSWRDCRGSDRGETCTFHVPTYLIGPVGWSSARPPAPTLTGVSAGRWGGVGHGEGFGRVRTFWGHQNHRPISAAIDGVMNDRITRVSNNRPRPIVVPT